jgi:hypothetical protein
MPRKIVVEFSLIPESKERPSSEIIKDIEDALMNEVTIPWCAKTLDIQIST